MDVSPSAAGRQVPRTRATAATHALGAAALLLSLGGIEALGSFGPAPEPEPLPVPTASYIPERAPILHLRPQLDDKEQQLSTFTLLARLPTATSLTAPAGADLRATADQEVGGAKAIDGAKAAAAGSRRELSHSGGADPSPLPRGDRSGPTPDCVFDCDDWESELE